LLPSLGLCRLEQTNQGSALLVAKNIRKEQEIWLCWLEFTVWFLPCLLAFATRKLCPCAEWRGCCLPRPHIPEGWNVGLNMLQLALISWASSWEGVLHDA